MTFLRPFLALFLALVVTLTSGAMAVARGDAQASVGQMVLCTGSGPTTVTVDADGQPVGPAHYCPDCALGAFFLPQTPLGLPRLTAVASRMTTPVRAISFLSIETADPTARGPPTLA